MGTYQIVHPTGHSEKGLSSEMISRLLLVVLAFSALASSSRMFVQEEYPCFTMRFDCINDCIENGGGNPDFQEGHCRKACEQIETSDGKCWTRLPRGQNI